MDGECVYCGAIGPITRDHVPPKGIFSEPRPDNLITVPACSQCHNSDVSKDDEYFRLILQVREEIHKHPDALKSYPALLRSLTRPQKAGMMNAFLKSIFLADLVTPSGIFIKKQLAIQTDMNRLRKVVTRILKGLFYYHREYRLPDGYDALVFDERSVQEWPPANLAEFSKNFIQPLLAHDGVTLGNNVFTYRFGFNKSDLNTTCWIFEFYGQARFLGLTLPPEK